MADGYTQVAPDSTGDKIDTSELTRADATVVNRQRVVIGDDVDPTQQAKVSSDGPGPADEALHVRTVGEVHVGGEVLAQVLIELRLMNFLLNQAFNFGRGADDLNLFRMDPMNDE
jgi:hypothetical protein